MTHDVDAGISNLFSFAYLSGGDLQYTSNQRLTTGMSTTSRTDITLSHIKSGMPGSKTLWRIVEAIFDISLFMIYCSR